MPGFTIIFKSAVVEINGQMNDIALKEKSFLGKSQDSLT